MKSPNGKNKKLSRVHDYVVEMWNGQKIPQQDWLGVGRLSGYGSSLEPFFVKERAF
jgi:hypothetical protein